jgi:hypothetical protein
VSVRPPLRDTRAAACVADVLSSAHGPPFAGKAGSVDYVVFPNE